MASNPTNPAIASSPAFPPVANLPFIDLRNGHLTPPALQFLQYLFALLSGTGSGTDVANLALGGASAAKLDSRLAELQPSALWPIPVREVSSSPIYWMPSLAGDTTPGTQTYGVQWGEACYIGPLVLVEFSIVLTALDGTTAGNVVVTDLPQEAQSSGKTQAGWVSSYSNITQGAGLTQLGVEIAPATNELIVIGSGSGAASAQLNASGLAATSAIRGGCCYFR